MTLENSLETQLLSYVDLNQDRLIGLVQDLVRIPSENTPPSGAERACQEYAANILRRGGFTTDVYSLDDVKALREHPQFWPGRNYSNRPNVGARLTGAGGGKSLILSGHIDTVPRGSQPWTRDPFSGDVDGNRLYGRGSNDMKAGIATNLFIAQAVNDLKLRLAGDLIIESVVDEEFGGVNGTLAGRLRGYTADAAVISEPSFLRVCAAQRGGRIAHITFRAPSGGILSEKGMAAGVADQLALFLSRVPAFSERRRRSAPPHHYYAHLADPVPVSVMKLFTSPWGATEPMTIADSCKVELYWQAMPGEEREAIDREFHDWFSSVLAERPDLFPSRPEIEFPYRWLPGSAVQPDEELVSELAGCAARVTGEAPPLAGIEGPCDMYIFHQVSGVPAVLWGARGGNTHAADEYVEIDTVVTAAKALLLFVSRWCGVAAN